MIASQLAKSSVVNLSHLDPTLILFTNDKISYIRSADCPANFSVAQAMRGGFFNTIRACSSNAQGSRGLRASVILVDEAAHVKMAMIKELVASIATVLHTVIIALSTVNGHDNWMSQIMVREDPVKQRNVAVHRVELVCERCKPFGLTQCPCKVGDVPPWQDPGNRELVQMIMNDKQLYKQEILGQIVASSSNNVFLAKYVDAVFTRPAYNLISLPQPRICFTFIDPKGLSRHQSYFAIITVLPTPDRGLLLVGMDETPETMYVQKKEFLQNYFTNLAQHSVCDSTTAHIIVVESNSDQSGHFLYPQIAESILKQDHPTCTVIPYNASAESDGGAWTGSITKLNGTSDVMELLMKYKMYRVSELVVAKNSRREDIQDEFIRQMKTMRATRSLKGTIQVDGKVSNHTHDDMAMSLILVTQVVTKYLHQLLERRAPVELGW